MNTFAKMQHHRLIRAYIENLITFRELKHLIDRRAYELIEKQKTLNVEALSDEDWIQFLYENDTYEPDYSDFYAETGYKVGSFCNLHNRRHPEDIPF